MNFTSDYQFQLFNDCAENCEGFASCGGMRNTAPCGCAWPIGSTKRYRCGECYIACRERSNFSDLIGTGLSLDQLNLEQKFEGNLPIYIPYTTHKCQHLLRSGFVGVDMRILFNSSRRGSAKLNPKFNSEKKIRTFLNVSRRCKLIAVLNGEDWMLESFWNSQRVNILKEIANLGFTYCTGPTFSVTPLTTEGTIMPYSHHTFMLMRHHKVISEIMNAGISAIPNLYWLDNDLREINKWGDWLIKNTTVHVISKDLTSTRTWGAIETKISELLFLMQRVGRTFHVLIVGTGQANAGKIVEKITNAGHTVSIITSAPILKGLHGNAYIKNGDKLSDQPLSKTDISIQDLIKKNLRDFEIHLKRMAS